MHELSVTQNIIDIVNRHAEEAGAQRVARINLVIGELSSIVDDSVQFYFDYLSEGSLAEGATLVFDRISVRLECGACQHVWQPDDMDWQCPHCGARAARVVKGREFYVDSIEVEDI